MLTGFCKEVNLEDSLLDGQSKLITEPGTSNALKDIVRKRNSVYFITNFLLSFRCGVSIQWVVFS